MNLIGITSMVAIIATATSAAGAASGNTVTRQALLAWYQARVVETEATALANDQASFAAGQYMRQNCKPLSTPYAGWEAFPVRRCDYSETGYRGEPNQATVRTFVYALFPSASQLTDWTLNACLDAQPDNVNECAGRLADRVWRASNAQFPVAGYVTEPAEVVPNPKNPHTPYCFQFRNGVTVSTKSWETRAMTATGGCGPARPEDVLGEVPVKIFGPARLSSVGRDQFKAAERAARPKIQWNTTIADASPAADGWSDAVGAEFRAAMTSDRNFLSFASAKAGFDKCDINILDKKAVRPKSC